MTDSYRPIARLLLTVLACILLPACGSLDLSRSLVSRISPYQLEILQGNFVSKEQVAALKSGMTRQQVTELLGTPLVASLFHANRWDYVFTFKGRSDQAQSRKLTVFFKEDRVERFEGDDMPSEAEFVAKLDSGRKLGKVPLLEATPEALSKFSASASTPAVPGSSVSFVVTPANVAGSYPPLELASPAPVR